MSIKNSRIKETLADRCFNAFNLIALSLFAIVIILPLLYVLANSFISNKELASSTNVIIPMHPTFAAYKLILFGSDDIVNGYKITLFRTIVGTCLSMIFTIFLAFFLSKKDIPGRTGITLFLFITMLFGGGLIPYYIVVKTTGLKDSIWVYIVPGLVSVWNALVLRNFMMEIPTELTEAAEIDGVGQIRLLFQIIIPLSKASLVTIAMFYAIGQWNSWFDAYIFVQDKTLYPLQLILRNILATATLNVDKLASANLSDLMGTLRPPTRAMQNAALVVTTLPIICVYPFVQKYFVKGIMIGSVKG